MMRGWPSTILVSLENAFMLSLDRALARLASRLGALLGAQLGTGQRQERVAVQAGVPDAELGPTRELDAWPCGTARTVASTAARRSGGFKLLSRPATSMLAARRFTSHSHGPGRVSSKSFTSKSKSPFRARRSRRS